MIPASLLLILVAVGLLVLGLTSGSSGMLIGSIVSSLLAAVALVVGARQSAAARRPDREPVPLDDIREFDSAPGFAAPPTVGAEQQFGTDPQFGPEPHGVDEFATAEPEFSAPDHEYASGAADSGPGDVDLDVDSQWETREQPVATESVDDSVDSAVREPDPDYHRASSMINAARTENADEQGWRRPAWDAHAEATAHSSMPGMNDSPPPLNDDFAEPDADDPDDEPLPQAVRPADAVRVARLDAEVLVVDGRPRYHLADCAHLVGRLTEPIQVFEAVELGFSPCGLCRPVDRLVAAAARR